MPEETKILLVPEESLYKSLKSIQSAIDSAGIQGVSLQVEYHKIACSVILHLGKNFDIRVYQALIAKMPESLRVDSMQAFFDKYSVVAFDEEGNASIDKEKGTKLGEALENAWWKAKKATPYVPYNFLEKLEGLLKTAESKVTKIQKEREKGFEPKDLITSAQVSALRGLVRSLKEAPEASAETCIEEVAA